MEGGEPGHQLLQAAEQGTLLVRVPRQHEAMVHEEVLTAAVTVRPQHLRDDAQSRQHVLRVGVWQWSVVGGCLVVERRQAVPGALEGGFSGSFSMQEGQCQKQAAAGIQGALCTPRTLLLVSHPHKPLSHPYPSRTTGSPASINPANQHPIYEGPETHLLSRPHVPGCHKVDGALPLQAPAAAAQRQRATGSS